MDLKKTLKIFYNEIEDFLKDEGFKIYKGKQIAIRRHESGFNEITFDLDKLYDFTYSVVTRLSIRNNKIQEIKFNIDEFYDKDTSTIMEGIFSITDISNSSDEDFEKDGGNILNFENPSSVEKWLNGFKRFMNVIGFDFFNKFHTIADFDKWLNTTVLDGNYNFDSGGLNWNDSISGLVAAKLAKNPEYDELYSIWHKELLRLGDKKTLDELEKMKFYLDKNFSS